MMCVWLWQQRYWSLSVHAVHIWQWLCIHALWPLTWEACSSSLGSKPALLSSQCSDGHPHLSLQLPPEGHGHSGRQVKPSPAGEDRTVVCKCLHPGAGQCGLGGTGALLQPRSSPECSAEHRAEVRPQQEVVAGEAAIKGSSLKWNSEWIG